MRSSCLLSRSGGSSMQQRCSTTARSGALSAHGGVRSTPASLPAAAAAAHGQQLCARTTSFSRSSMALTVAAAAGAGGSSSSSSTRAPRGGAKPPSKQPQATTVVVAPPPTEEAPPALANPPLGFSNNIVPAAPLVVTPPLDGRPLVDSSDEELDDEGAASGLGPRGSPARTTHSSAYRCLVLDSRYLPVNVIAWFRAVVMGESGKVDVLEYHAQGFAYSAYRAHPLPAVLRVRTFVDVHEFAGKLSLTRKNIMLRDAHRCQYCGAGRDLTLDHVVPVCRGGVNTWQNLVTACMACNQRKGDKSLAQLGWSLPRVPREPSPQEVGIIAGISRSDLEHPPQPWAPYLATFKQVLEKAQRRAARSASGSGSGSGGAGMHGAAAAADGFAASQSELLLRGGSGGSRSKKAVAAAAAAPGAAPPAVVGSSKKGGGAKGVSSTAKRVRH